MLSQRIFGEVVTMLIHVLQNVISGVCIGYALCEGSGSAITPYLGGMSIAGRLKLCLLCPSQVISDFSCDIGFTIEMI
jgi:hypothetical protein